VKAQRAELRAVSRGLYDKGAVKARLRALFLERGRGTGSDLARAVGVTPTSANRWASEHGDCPDAAYWPAIERFFGLPPGELARAGGMTPPPAAPGGSVGLLDVGGLTPENRLRVEGYVRALLDTQHTS
jgi:hypothetical protein